MRKSRRDAGVVQVLLKRLDEERLPYALELKARVDAGECLDDHDVRFLRQVFMDASTAQRLCAKHPELQSLVGRLVALYTDITDRALENERATQGRNHALPNWK